MPWISVHQEVDGTKLRRLYRAIGCSKFEALGILNFLWFWGMKNADETGLAVDADLDVLSRYLRRGLPARHGQSGASPCGHRLD